MEGFIQPEKVLKELKLKKNMETAEFGCGTGKFSFLLAEKLEDGKVYALDVQPEVLSALKKEADLRSLYNIETIHCDLEEKNGSTLLDNSLDIVLIPNVLFQVEKKKEMISEAKRIVKRKGQILIIDWRSGASFGPAKENRVKPEQIKKIAQDLGLKFKKEFEAGSFHYGLLFKKP